MNLPVQPPFPPMEAKLVADIPEGPDWQYEPKWDGFRCLAFRDGDEIELQSKSSQSLTRYFPELVEALEKVKARQFVLDGEIVILGGGKLNFDDLLQRIHPAASRVMKLSQETPASLVLFDLLVDGGASQVAESLSVRRAKLEAFAAKYLSKFPIFILSPETSDSAIAKEWMATLRGQLDGIVAKDKTRPYASGERAMQKIKTVRTADCVVGGFRYLAKEKLVGSLLLGLYDGEGLLHHVGFTSSIDAAARPDLTRKLEALIGTSSFTGKAPGGPSRWSTKKSTEWEALKPKLVAEVGYDHFTGGRFRHGTSLVRWRPDKSPAQCLMDQVDSETKSPLSLVG